MSGEATKKQQNTQNPREDEKSNQGSNKNQQNYNPNVDRNNPKKQSEQGGQQQGVRAPGTDRDKGDQCRAEEQEGRRDRGNGIEAS